jgi:hypothetical protein
MEVSSSRTAFVPGAGGAILGRPGRLPVNQQDMP